MIYIVLIFSCIFAFVLGIPLGVLIQKRRIRKAFQRFSDIDEDVTKEMLAEYKEKSE